MSGLHAVNVHLTPHQHSRLRNGHQIQLAHGQIGAGSHRLMVHHETHKKMHKAHRLGKGVRIHLTPHELHASGLKELAQKAGQYYTEHVKPHVKGFLRAGVKKAAKAGIRAYNTATLGALEPEINSLENRYLDPAVDWLGRTTGAYGMRHHSHRAHHGRGQPMLMPDMSYGSGRRHSRGPHGGSFRAI